MKIEEFIKQQQDNYSSDFHSGRRHAVKAAILATVEFLSKIGIDGAIKGAVTPDYVVGEDNNSRDIKYDIFESDDIVYKKTEFLEALPAIAEIERLNRKLTQQALRHEDELQKYRTLMVDKEEQLKQKDINQLELIAEKNDLIAALATINPELKKVAEAYRALEAENAQLRNAGAEIVRVDQLKVGQVKELEQKLQKTVAFIESISIRELDSMNVIKRGQLMKEIGVSK